MAGKEINPEVVRKILQYLKFNKEGDRMRMIAWHLRENPYTVLPTLIYLKKHGIVETVSYSDPANMEYYEKWRLVENIR